MFTPVLHEINRRPGELQYLYVSLSNICNAHCVYCDVHTQPPPRWQYSREDLAQLFGRAAAIGCRIVHFMGGGEPLVALTFDAAASLCTGLGLGIAITTNGSHLRERMQGSLRDARVVLVIVSLDSHLEAAHDDMRRMPGLFRRAMNGIAATRAAHPNARIVLNHVTTRHNIDDVEAFAGLAARSGATAVNLIPVKDNPSLAAEPQQASALTARLASWKPPVEILMDHEDVIDWSERQNGVPSSREYRCIFPEYALYIDMPTGSAFPCDCTVHRSPQERFDVGNVRERDLGEIWRGASIRELRAELASPCDPGCKADCDWNNRRTNRALRGAWPAEVTA